MGFKNGTDGSVKVAADAVLAAQAPHAFIGMTKMGASAIFHTRGNADCHIILRGGKKPNYHAADIQAACETLAQAELRPQVMVDLSHANSSKQHRKQIDVAADLAAQVAAGDLRIMGVMIESHLQEGRQDIVPGQALKPGVSVTDACISLAQTAPVLAQLAQAVRQRLRTAATGRLRGLAFGVRLHCAPCAPRNFPGPQGVRPSGKLKSVGRGGNCSTAAHFGRIPTKGQESA